MTEQMSDEYLVHELRNWGDRIAGPSRERNATEALVSAAAEAIDRLRAEVKRLNEWADGYTDSMLKERRLAEETIQEKQRHNTLLREVAAAGERLAVGVKLDLPTVEIHADEVVCKAEDARSGGALFAKPKDGGAKDQEIDRLRAERDSAQLCFDELQAAHGRLQRHNERLRAELAKAREFIAYVAESSEHGWERTFDAEPCEVFEKAENFLKAKDGGAL